MKRKVKRPFDNEQFRKGYVAGMFAAEKELNTELLHFAEKAHKIMSEGTFPDYGIKINFKDPYNTITTNLDMKTEEKAKRYDEALEWMRKVYPTLTGAAKEDAEHYFPELKESKESKDERIRKAIVTLIKDLQHYSTNYAGVDPTEMLAWLEKQKEQHKEELVYRMNGLMQEYVKEGEDDAEKEHRLKCYQLFWDALEDADFFEQKEQKPAEWSEEDEEMIEGIIGDLCALKDWIIKYDTNWLANPVLKNIDKRIAWLKSLKDRGNFPKSNTNSPSEWSEEKEKAVDSYVDEIIKWEDAHKDWDRQVIRATAYHFFNFQPKQEWSEEDEKLRKNIIWLLEIHPSYRKEVDWLKSLSSHSHWKPSEEQMQALSETIAFAPDTFKPKCTLETLQNDLKKLMEN